MAKYIFVMGGVLSSLGKGIATASIGLLLKSMGYKVVLQKFDPYLNVDPGTMSPFQHGEVFVTNDGAETDLDLGHYERFVDQDCSRESSCSAGQVYESVLTNERKGIYLGNTVQVIPHVTDEIKRRITAQAEGNDFVISEIGGTVGDIEGLPFLEAIRQLHLDLGNENTLNILLTYVPYIKSAGELKTKPSQHSAYKLREIGIQPDILLCRSEKQFGDEIYSKISLFTNVAKECVINAIDVNCVYEIPMNYNKANLPEIICRHFKMETRPIDLSHWQEFLDNRKHSEDSVKIAVCGKYIRHQDAYKSIVEALYHAAAKLKKKIIITWVDSERVFDRNRLDKELSGIDGILIPGGFGIHGIDSKIAIAQYARTRNIPLLGICLGMQVMAIEFARNVCKIDLAHSTEFDENSAQPVIRLMEGLSNQKQRGKTMRLGAYTCKLSEGSLAHRTYGSLKISERHRHRYEFNNDYRQIMIDAGLCLSGVSESGDMVEILEYPTNDFYLGVQFHPEFKSRPHRPHPLFVNLLRAAIKA
ncbi:MAG: CTP synthase [Candidatus Cloacimonadaceae bacterium]|nr:CTP synthase [Candidatus Cloacimonadota bacterium]MDY0128458.1 CTP synthase [Candidatus Cloacimonadaceae bacterium]MCB5255118.1 CTP synthase [Candidatus Cloacimonadota bacterium]MCK9177664.1 CTP synthase [Candidatus Cloacimonadota bacterium]MCK9242929.1 CTP synthase [Candidatus Cloacimonadota bacterium]